MKRKFNYERPRSYTYERPRSYTYRTQEPLSDVLKNNPWHIPLDAQCSCMQSAEIKSRHDIDSLEITLPDCYLCDNTRISPIPWSELVGA